MPRFNCLQERTTSQLTTEYGWSINRTYLTRAYLSGKSRGFL